MVHWQRSLSPTIGRETQARTLAEYNDAFFQRYQALADEGYDHYKQLHDSGRWNFSGTIDPTTELGQVIDGYAWSHLKDWVQRADGLVEPGLVKINRRPMNPSWVPDEAMYRIPDARTSNQIFDLTIGHKDLTTPQIADFPRFAPNSRVTIVRPTQMGGSYSIATPP